jgi:hypothetical protein
MTSQYKKIYKTYKPKSSQTYEFSDSHPGYKFSHLSKSKHSTIPRITLPQNKLCFLEEFELQHTNSTEKSHDKQEMYAKMALLMFYPYQKLNDFDRQWKLLEKFHQELQCHLLKKYTKFWEKGFEILQNIEDRATLEKTCQTCCRPNFNGNH